MQTKRINQIEVKRGFTGYSYSMRNLNVTDPTFLKITKRVARVNSDVFEKFEVERSKPIESYELIRLVPLEYIAEKTTVVAKNDEE